MVIPFGAYGAQSDFEKAAISILSSFLRGFGAVGSITLNDGLGHFGPKQGDDADHCRLFGGIWIAIENLLNFASPVTDHDRKLIREHRSYIVIKTGVSGEALKILNDASDNILLGQACFDVYSLQSNPGNSSVVTVETRLSENVRLIVSRLGATQLIITRRHHEL